MENNNYTIALLIDTENVSSKYLEALKEELNVLGKVTYLRMYGDFTLSSSKNWKTLANDYAITPVQQYRYTKGKNASDSRLIIDAMDILYSENVDAFCIMSSDSDYTGLVKRLKESNIFVIGAGEKKTADSFVKACDRFFYLDELSEKEVETPKEKKEKDTKKKKKKTSKVEDAKAAKELLKEEVEKFAIKILENNPGPYPLSKLMQKVYQRFPSFNFKKYKARRAQDFFSGSKESKFVISKGKATEILIELK
jgi:uncharacterized LabA/DUF88 family protein